VQLPAALLPPSTNGHRKRCATSRANAATATKKEFFSEKKNQKTLAYKEFVLVQRSGQ
jgi:hypothetical protein